MNITKALANEIANKLVVNKTTEIKSLTEDIREKFEAMYISTIPSRVMDLFNAHPSYVRTRSSFQLSGNGMNYEYMNTRREVPCISGTFCPTSEQARVLIRLKDNINNKKDERDLLVKELEATIYGLRTYKRVEDNFPEAFELLPKIISNKLMIDLTDLRNKIK